MLLQQLDYNKEKIINDDLMFQGSVQRTYIKKTRDSAGNRDYYFIYLYKINENSDMNCQGYIYFYLDFDTKTSEYIGSYVKPDYRNNGLASLLTSSWIKLCLDYNINNLKTIRRQRKPFLLYLLKTYTFELPNVSVYQTSDNNIHIYRKDNSNEKYLLFENKKQKETFRHGKIYREDNYNILDDPSSSYEKLDTVILSKKYFLQDKETAYQKALRIENEHK